MKAQQARRAWDLCRSPTPSRVHVETLRDPFLKTALSLSMSQRCVFLLVSQRSSRTSYFRMRSCAGGAGGASRRHEDRRLQRKARPQHNSDSSAFCEGFASVRLGIQICLENPSAGSLTSNFRKPERRPLGPKLAIGPRSWENGVAGDGGWSRSVGVCIGSAGADNHRQSEGGHIVWSCFYLSFVAVAPKSILKLPAPIHSQHKTIPET